MIPALEAATAASPCAEIRTGNTYIYEYVPEPVGQTIVTFEVRANNDAHISLSGDSNDLPEIYEIVIGYVCMCVCVRMCMHECILWESVCVSVNE